jgi:integrase/recombinase XerD
MSGLLVISPEPYHASDHYQVLMFRTWKLSPNTVTQRLAALRFFYCKGLKRRWSIAEMPYPKEVLRLPQHTPFHNVAATTHARLTPLPVVLNGTR